MSRNFSVDFRTGSDGRMKTHAPPSLLGPMTGNVRGSSIGNAFKGKVNGSPSSDTKDGTILSGELTY